MTLNTCFLIVEVNGKNIWRELEIHGINVNLFDGLIYLHYKNGLGFLIQVTFGFLVEWTELG